MDGCSLSTGGRQPACDSLLLVPCLILAITGDQKTAFFAVRKDIIMKVSDLVEIVATEADLSNADTRKVIDAVVEAMTQAAIRGEEVTLPNFGKFKVKDVPAREGRNPATGATIQIAASRKLGFTPAKALKDALNGGK